MAARTQTFTIDVPNVGLVNVHRTEMESFLGPTGRWQVDWVARTDGNPFTPEERAAAKAQADALP